MSVQLLEKEKIIAPFLGSPLSFIVGQDPLGLLNTGDRTFNLLLPGLNNVTERIRYYSFYAWFFDFYAEEIRKPSKKEQFKYLRRAEFILALLAAKNNQQGIGGITKALEIYNEQTETFILENGTGENKQNFENTYWKNPRGIFGQNYVSSLSPSQLAIIQEFEEDSGVFTRSDLQLENVISGKQLAKAFKENSTESIIGIFQNAIINGEVTQMDLEELSHTINLRKVPINTTEHQLLWQMLINADKPISQTPTFHRKRTIQLLLRQIEQQGETIKDIDFSYFAYYNQGKLNNEIDDTLFLWYYYQVEQFWHMISTGSLSLFLELLEIETDGTWIIENEFIQETSVKIHTFLIENKKAEQQSTFDSLNSPKETEEELLKIIRQEKNIGAMAYNILLLKKVFTQNKEMLPLLEKMAFKNGLMSESNFLNSIKQLNKIDDISLTDFINYFLKKYVVIRHQWIALKKMNNTQTTEKFVREEGLIRFVSNIHYGFSSPRLNTLIKFFEDLQLIEEGQLSLKGKELLNNLND